MKLMARQDRVLLAGPGVAVALPAQVDGHPTPSRAGAAIHRAKERGRNGVRLAVETAVA